MDRCSPEAPSDGSDQTAAAVILRSLAEYGVKYVFANFGTDHTPLLEAAAKIRQRDPDALPEFVICPHESIALSAAHGYAAVTSEPQAVFVHVDVGTQNLGAMVHNAHRGDAPVFIFAGLAPITHSGRPSARSSRAHFLQDVYDQSEIIDQFCRWTGEYRPPADPDEFVARGLELASTPRRGPVYLTATREALETRTRATPGSRSIESVGPTVADGESADQIASMIRKADSPLVITSKLGVNVPERSVESLVDFAETVGAGVVEQSPAALCFPRTHDQHAGFRPKPAIERADLVVLVDTDVPWVPSTDMPVDLDIPIVQIDVDPEKRHYPQWDFQVDYTVRANPERTLSAVANRIDPDTGESGRETWRSVNERRREELSEQLRDHYRDDRLTSAVLTDAVNDVIDDAAIVLNEATTNLDTVLRYLDAERPGSYFSSHGSGLGWLPGAAVGAKLADSDRLVVSLVGDGSYVFGNPTAAAWTAAKSDAPSLTVVYNNSGWNAVRLSTLKAHPEGDAATEDVAESKFSPTMDLSQAAHVVDAHTSVVQSVDELDEKLREGVHAVESGIPAVVDVRIEPI